MECSFCYQWERRIFLMRSISVPHLFDISSVKCRLSCGYELKFILFWFVLTVHALLFPQNFEDDMATRQSEVDRLTKAHKRRRSTDIGIGGIPMLDRSRRGKGSRPLSREPSPGPDASRNPRVAALHNKWKQVWLMAMDRRRRLQDSLDRQAEVTFEIKSINYKRPPALVSWYIS